MSAELSVSLFIESSALAVGLATDPTVGSLSSKKKKSMRKTHQLRLSKLVDNISLSLKTGGWAVSNNFLPLDLVRRVRIKASLFQDRYGQSQSWVG